MSRLLKLTVFALAFLAALLIGHQNARAATLTNTPDSRLDAIASSIAGHPVSVYCENDLAAWAAGASPGAWGYTWAPHWNYLLKADQQNVVWIHPRMCLTLHSILDNPGGTSPFEAALAIHVLVHESFHQRDGVYGDCTNTDQSCEGRTDCAALAFDETAETTLFGYPATVTTPTNVYRYVRRKVKGHWRRVRVRRVLTTISRDPTLDYMHDVQQENHRLLGLSYPQYRGDC